jgi:hypothetical protein
VADEIHHKTQIALYNDGRLVRKSGQPGTNLPGFLRPAAMRWKRACQRTRRLVLGIRVQMAQLARTSGDRGCYILVFQDYVNQDNTP